MMNAAKPKPTDELDDKVLGLDGKTDRDRGREYNADTDAPGAKSASTSDGPAPDPQPTPEEVAQQEAALAAAEQRDGNLNPDEQAAADAAKAETPAYIPGPGSDTTPATPEPDPLPEEPTEPGWYATDDDERGHAIIFLLDAKGKWHAVSSAFHVEDAQWWYVANGGNVKLLAPLLSPAAKKVLEDQAREAESADASWA